jgi:TRAP-type mannitol/chloroaromatic compound transport system permease small subunit
MEKSTGALKEWVVPLVFVLCAGWTTWHMPAFILDWAPPADPSNLAALYERSDVAPGLPGLFGGYADAIDWLSLLLLPVIGFIGVRGVLRAPMEFEDWRPIDRIAVFIGRLTMMLVIVLCCVMIYEVVLRYVFERPTLWANELSLWLAGFVFLCSGLYAMQQRSHIRIFLLYDVLPRGLQRTCDVISTALIVAFAFFLFYGGYGEAFDKFFRWERFGTAFDPPIPATLKPMVLIIVVLVAVQAVINLIADWNAEPVKHSAADDIDQDELEKLRAAVGSDGTAGLDVTRGAIQSQKYKAD